MTEPQTLDDLDDEAPDTLTAALALAAMGFRVFPLRERGKMPAEARPWREMATTDPASIAAMFAGTSRNIGIACGASGVTVLDEDVAEGLTKAAGGRELPRTFTVSTGKGRHVFYLTPAGVAIGNSTALKAYGVDVRGAGGYVVGAGSVHENGTRYRIVDPSPVAPMPAWLIDVIADRPKPEAGLPEGWEEVTPFGPRGLDAVPEQIPAGSRHDELVRFAASMRGRNLPRSEAEALMRVAWSRCAQPPHAPTPVTWAEALAKLDDVWRRYQPNPEAIIQPEAESVSDRPTFDLVPLPELLAEPDEPVAYRIEGLLPVGTRAVLAAQFKAGKTTTRDNLVRSLADGSPFLDEFAVTQLAEGGTVVVIDNEMNRGQIRRWLRDQGIAHPERVRVAILRGQVARFNLIDPATRYAWAEALREAGAEVVIFDCLRPVLDALGLDESHDAGRFLTAFDALLRDAEVTEAVLIHHMGHNGERSRGDSRIRDWPDVEWRLVREKPADGDDADPSARRFFSAYGRDVDVSESALIYDAESRHLSIIEGESRADAKKASSNVQAEAVAYIRANPGATTREIREAIHRGNADVSKALADAVELHVIERVNVGTGGRPIYHHYPTVPTVPNGSENRQPTVLRSPPFRGTGTVRPENAGTETDARTDDDRCLRCGNGLDRAALLADDGLCTRCRTAEEVGR